jgi:transposase
MKTQHRKEPEVAIERLDDIPLLIALQKQIGLGEIIDKAIARHWLHQGLSLGQLIVVWNAYVLSQADHRKVAVEDWAVEHHQMLSELLDTPLRRTDFTDDRLGQALGHLAFDEAWQEIESQLWHKSVSVYRLNPERVRLDATRLSGYHTPFAGLMQHGYDSQTPNQTQVKLMAASIDCGASGHLIATDIASGNTADDPLYLPVIQRVRQTFDERGLLYIGDSKMSALSIRAQLASGGDFYLVPLAKVGEVPKLYDQCVSRIVSGAQEATLIYKTNTLGQSTELIAAGYQTTRPQEATKASGQRYTWEERILVV